MGFLIETLDGRRNEQPGVCSFRLVFLDAQIRARLKFPVFVIKSRIKKYLNN